MSYGNATFRAMDCASPEPSADVEAAVRGFLSHSPFLETVGLRIEHVELDRAEVSVAFGDAVVNSVGAIHGGVISTLIDVAAGAAARTGALDGVSPGATVALSINFLRAARRDALHARARVLRRTRTLCFCEVEVAGEHREEPVATGLVTYRIDTTPSL